MPPRRTSGSSPLVRTKHDRPKAKTEQAAAPKPQPVVVGIGCSGASFRSLERLFAHFPSDTGAAFVVVFQQAAGMSSAKVLESLSRQSRMPAVLIDEGVELCADHVYLVPQNLVVTIKGGRLHTQVSEEPLGARGAIDSFMLSLADEAQERGVAVLLATHSAEIAAGAARVLHMRDGVLEGQ